MNIPKLRFRGFSGGWDNQLLDTLGKFSKGAVLAKSDLSDTGKPCILYGELYTKYNEIATEIYSKTLNDDKRLVFSRKNDVLIPASGETAIDIATATCVPCDDVVLGGDLNIFRPHSVDGRVVSYILNNKRKLDIAKLAQGKSVVHIGASALKTVNMSYPQDKNEQQKIADFLSTFDEKIENQQSIIKNLEQQKKGFMQKIFSCKLRFKDQNGNDFPQWEENKLGEVCDVIGGGTPSTSEENYWNGNIQWFTPSEIGSQKYVSTSKRTISENGLKNSSAKLLPKGSVLLSTRATLGEMSICTQEVTTNQGFQSLVVKPSYELEYIYYLQDIIKKYCFKHSSGSTFLEISKSNLQQCILPCPTLQEQQKIADFLSAFDEKIQTEKQILTHLQNTKKGLLQQMFC